MSQEPMLAPQLLLVDDDIDFCRVMSKAFVRRGFEVTLAHDVQQAVEIALTRSPEFALIDLSMPGESGLALITKLKALDDNTRIVVLTGYASVATAVEAIKLGAIHYLSKPASMTDIMAAFNRTTGDPDLEIEERRLSVDRLEWEHIQTVLLENSGNISKTARQLRMHRRTLQRKLAKRPTRD